MGASLVLVLGGAGCQTFNMTQEKFEQQQKGQYVQTPEAEAVEVSGWFLQFFGPWLSCR